MIYTSYFANIKKLPKDLKLVSIARGTPDWFTGLRCEALAPILGHSNDGEKQSKSCYKSKLYKRIRKAA